MAVSPHRLNHPVVVDVDGARAGIDLADSLGRRGLVGRLVHHGGRWSVEFAAAHERSESLRDEVVRALEEWLDDRGLAEAVVHVGDESVVALAAVAARR